MIRLGRISYVNMAPVFYRLEADVDEVSGVPTDLNARLLDGAIDLAPISSIEYARNADRLRILPRLCVSSEGAVDSIQLVSRTPLEQVRTVAVTEAPRRVVAREVERPRRNWKKTAAVIGGSTAAGAGLGGIIGGKKGALIGAAIGGGASTIYETTR